MIRQFLSNIFCPVLQCISSINIFAMIQYFCNSMSGLEMKAFMLNHPFPNWYCEILRLFGRLNPLLCPNVLKQRLEDITLPHTTNSSDTSKALVDVRCDRKKASKRAFLWKNRRGREIDLAAAAEVKSHMACFDKIPSLQGWKWGKKNVILLLLCMTVDVCSADEVI